MSQNSVATETIFANKDAAAKPLVHYQGVPLDQLPHALMTTTLSRKGGNISYDLHGDATYRHYFGGISYKILKSGYATPLPGSRPDMLTYLLLSGEVLDRENRLAGIWSMRLEIIISGEEGELEVINGRMDVKYPTLMELHDTYAPTRSVFLKEESFDIFQSLIQQREILRERNIHQLTKPIERTLNIRAKTTPEVFGIQEIVTEEVEVIPLKQ